MTARRRRCDRDQCPPHDGREYGGAGTCRRLTTCCFIFAVRSPCHGAPTRHRNTASGSCTTTRHSTSRTGPVTGIRRCCPPGRTRMVRQGLVPLVAPWLAAHELFDGLVNQPDELPSILPEFETHVVAQVRARLDHVGPNDLLVLTGAGALFGLLRVSRLTQSVAEVKLPRFRGHRHICVRGVHDVEVKTSLRR
jgi:hypothetical protein